ncbi:pilus assembly protein [Leeia sp.]|uniref:pilus assembly protein n=1 Tax=Leeia sp. TaxID=2884678 RepID=UPI0035AE909A
MKAVHATFPARFQPTVLSRCVTAVLLTALGTASHAALAPTPYPSLPQYSSTNVTPNILLFIDNSGSMGTKDIPLSSGGTGTRMSVAKTVAKDLINNNKALNWGLAAFNPNNNTTAGVIRQVIKSRSVAADQTAINNSIDGLNPDTWTPLAEAYYEMTRYWRGMNTFYWTGGTPATSITPIMPYTRPITLRCQKNFTIVLTDGEPTQDATFPTAVQDSLKTSYPGNELYDYSKMMYTEDILNTTATDADGVSFNDPNYLKQNLVTYTVGFGVDFSNTSSTAYKRLEKAALDAGGKVYSAQSQAELTAALSNAVNDISRQVSNARGVAGGASSADPNIGIAYRPLYNPSPDGPSRWTGDVLLQSISDLRTGLAGVSASAKLSAKAAGNTWWSSGRVVLSSMVNGNDGTAATTPLAFRSSNVQSTSSTLSEQYWGALGANDTIRGNVVDFVRGKEGISGFRSRTDGTTIKLLGDIIDNVPAQVANPDGQTNETDYTAFKTAQANRRMVFVGANDGMLHGFYGGTVNSGTVTPMDEVMAYVPSKSYYNLGELKETTYGQVASAHPHTYFVNGQLQISDVRISAGNWRTYMLGGMGQGGQGMFALDVTSMSQFSESSPSTTVKWEFTDRHDISMGYQFARPLITTVRTNTTDKAVPAAIFTSGLDNNSNDSSQQTARVDSNNSAALYVVNLTTGALIRKITLPSSPTDYSKNLTLGAPAGLDLFNDGVVDFIYAGDNKGNLWRFNLSSDVNSNWKTDDVPFFKAQNGSSQDQVIMHRPIISPVFGVDVNGAPDTSNPIGNMISFGTGRFVYPGDKTDNTVQTLYGVLDDMSTLNASTTITRANLQQQSMYSQVVTVPVSDTTRVPGEYKTSTDTAVPLTGSSPKKGWYIDLPGTGERLAGAPYYDGEFDVAIFGSGLPVSSSQCAAGGDGYMYGVDPASGKPKAGFLEIKKDGYANVDDKLSFSSLTPNSRYVSATHLGYYPGEITKVDAKSLIKNVDGLNGSGSTLGNAGSSVAMRDSNISGIFAGLGTGAAASGVSRGNSVPYGVPGGSGGSLVTGCTVGTCVSAPPRPGTPPSNVSVERVTWRELIQ